MNRLLKLCGLSSPNLALCDNSRGIDQLYYDLAHLKFSKPSLDATVFREVRVNKAYFSPLQILEIKLAFTEELMRSSAKISSKGFSTLSAITSTNCARSNKKCKDHHLEGVEF